MPDEKTKYSAAEKREAVLNVLRFFLSRPFNAKYVLEPFAKLLGAIYHQGAEAGQSFVYIPATRKNAVLLVAHADTVDNGDQAQTLLETDLSIRNADQSKILGADDRAGCAILWLLKNLGHGLLITDGEEHHLVGAKYLRDSFPELYDEINSRYQFMVEFDRSNSMEYKCYDVGTDDFHAYIQQKLHFTEPDKSSSTDIRALCRNICGVNLSVGYYNQHKPNEILMKTDWLLTLNKVYKWLSEPDLPKFKLEKKTTFKYVADIYPPIRCTVDPDDPSLKYYEGQIRRIFFSVFMNEDEEMPESFLEKEGLAMGRKALEIVAKYAQISMADDNIRFISNTFHEPINAAVNGADIVEKLKAAGWEIDGLNVIND